MKVYLLSGGILDCDRSVIHPGDDSRRRVTVPVPQVFITAEGRNVLIDTGCPPAAAGDDDALRRELEIEPAEIRPNIASEERPDRQLATLGLQPSDLTMVINTHFHFDHAGGNPLFAGVPVAAQEAEYEAAQREEGPRWWDAPGLEFTLVKGHWSPLPGVEMLHTPGHTPGHQSMLIRLKTGPPLLFTWDAVYTEEHWREDKLGAVEDVPAARRSIEGLRKIAAEENARVIFGHDIGQWESFGMLGRKAPRLVASDEE